MNKLKPGSEPVETWKEFYPPLVAEQVTAGQHYSILRVGGVQYAYTSYESHVLALRQIWEAGLVPTSGPGSVPAADLPTVAPQLKGIDTDLTGLKPSDVKRRRRRFA